MADAQKIIDKLGEQLGAVMVQMIILQLELEESQKEEEK